MAARKRRERGTGATRQLPSGRWQARFRGPDGTMRPAPITFDTKLDADTWLKSQTSDVARGMWQPPDHTAGGPAPTLKTYAENWLATRDLRPRTRQKYDSMLRNHILPVLGSARIDRITPITVRNWYSQVAPDHPRIKAHAYALLRVIMNTAHSEDLLPKGNPCRIRGAGQAPKRQHTPKPATLPELEVMVKAVDERWAPMILLAAWCALRFGELTELRRKDFDLDEGVVYITRNAQYVADGAAPGAGTWYVGPPKSDAGVRAVSIPPHLIPVLTKHLAMYTGRSKDALLWTATPQMRRHGLTAAHDDHVSLQSWNYYWHKARKAAGREDLRFHDLRHTGATLAAASGATLKELMARLGHTTARAAMVYQAAAHERDKAIAAALSDIAATGGKVIPLRKVGS